ncbi:ATP-binding cassette domain-containing protein [Maribellus comscasis]|uniref:ATP-binding cassette domain-containing protein n=1 Tax=Maribellus comscasis TaxID=2681766 RepID=A0A6I6JPN7_9BACT|nr:ABC transporter ATP-binding protein [Maribellus comscasis]QGY42192.1 ATP-binding cassette domain-containing protein [Maribellus comscasis]
MSYNLDTLHEEKKEKKRLGFASVKSLVAHMVEEKKILLVAFVAMVIAALLNLAGPILIGYAVDNYIQTGKYHGLVIFGSILLGTYIVALVAGYLQTRLMGGVGQRMLYTLRNSVFEKLQDLPYDFFNQNKTGDLISRINNDTDKINQFFSQSLMQFLRVILIMVGAGIFLVSIFWKLGLAALSPAIIIWIFTKLISPWVKKKNAESLKSVGNLSSEVQESLNNFKVVVAFNRRDYFRQRFAFVNRKNYSAAVRAGIANNIFLPVYTLFSNLGLMIVLTLGIYFISVGEFTVGLLISFVAYVNSFYNPLRQLASLWANFQTALAAWDRIRRILDLENNLPRVGSKSVDDTATLVSFRDVSFSYPNGNEVLHNINFNLRKGKIYAFVGPTGGGKTTTASLISRLYDPTKGTVLLDGKDIRSFSAAERVKRIGFILQDPYLFSGTIRDNILYGNEEYKNIRNKELEKIFHDTGLETLLQRFERGLDTKVNDAGDGISLGQKQLIAFMRAVLRKPDLLILDEATANIDTVTEQLLDEIIRKLPTETTKVIIAHRLNTIANADVIYFVNTGNVTRAGSLKDAVDMLMKGKMAS